MPSKGTGRGARGGGGGPRRSVGRAETIEELVEETVVERDRSVGGGGVDVNECS